MDAFAPILELGLVLVSVIGVDEAVVTATCGLFLHLVFTLFDMSTWHTTVAVTLKLARFERAHPDCGAMTHIRLNRTQNPTTRGTDQLRLWCRWIAMAFRNSPSL